MSDAEPVKSIVTPTRLDYTYTAVGAQTRFLNGISRGRILGQRCPQCRKVYVPPRGACPRCGVPTDEEVEVSGQGTVTTFCVVNVPSENIHLELPYVAAHILLDGADIPFCTSSATATRATSAWACGSRRSGCPTRSGADAREHQVLPAHRRARRRRSRRTRSTSDARRRRHLLRPDAQRAARSRPQRGRDAHAGDRARRSRAPASAKARSTSPARAAPTTWPARRSRSCDASTRRRLAADLASPTSRWTAPGRSTRPG